jgi:hypothetical protein
MAFLFMQVEKVLGPPDGLHWKLAYHLWVLKRPIREFRHRELKSGGGLLHALRAKEQIIQDLRSDLREIGNAAPTIPEADYKDKICPVTKEICPSTCDWCVLWENDSAPLHGANLFPASM